MDFSKMINHKVLMDRKEYTIVSIFSTHIGNLIAVKLSYKVGNNVETEHMMSNVLANKINQGLAKVLPPESETIRLGSKG